jgi:hypothetical protein
LTAPATGRRRGRLLRLDPAPAPALDGIYSVLCGRPPDAADFFAGNIKDKWRPARLLAAPEISSNGFPRRATRRPDRAAQPSVARAARRLSKAHAMHRSRRDFEHARPPDRLTDLLLARSCLPGSAGPVRSWSALRREEIWPHFTAGSAFHWRTSLRKCVEDLSVCSSLHYIDELALLVRANGVAWSFFQ